MGSNVATKRQWNNGGSLEKRQIAARRPKSKEAVQTSCRFEKPAASSKDYFYWLTQFFAVQCSISCVPDAVTNRFNGWQKSLSIQQGENKKKLSELWDRM
jgi:hypothetical protein